MRRVIYLPELRGATPILGWGIVLAGLTMMVGASATVGAGIGWAATSKHPTRNTALLLGAAAVGYALLDLPAVIPGLVPLR
jgi:hypothetical protein